MADLNILRNKIEQIQEEFEKKRLKILDDMEIEIAEAINSQGISNAENNAQNRIEILYNISENEMISFLGETTFNEEDKREVEELIYKFFGYKSSTNRIIDSIIINKSKFIEVNTTEACINCHHVNFDGKYKMELEKIIDEYFDFSSLKPLLLIEMAINKKRESIGIHCPICGETKVDLIKTLVNGEIACHGMDFTVSIFVYPNRDGEIETTMNISKFSMPGEKEESVKVLNSIVLKIKDSNYSNPFLYLRARITSDGWKTLSKIQGFSLETANNIREQVIQHLRK
ncbi:MAG TPA: hypothetical protein PK649_05230 [Vicingus sp.]|nr:hypothetical protein [Vicingus sp.]HRP58954.1 hypothetical protein [Vicingus sp.]